MKYVIGISFFIFALPVFGDSITREQLIKSAFVERFAWFVEWPEDKDVSIKKQGFVIGIVGKSMLINALDEYFKSRKIKGTDVQITSLNESDTSFNGHILIIATSLVNSKKLSPILTRAQDRSILTIGDAPGLCAKGVHINFKVENNQISFQINQKMAENAGLIINSKLLQLAEIINVIPSDGVKTSGG